MTVISFTKLLRPASLVAALVLLALMVSSARAVTLEGGLVSDGGRGYTRDRKTSGGGWDPSHHHHPNRHSTGDGDLPIPRLATADDDRLRLDPAPILNCPIRCKCYRQPYKAARLLDPLLTVNCSGQGFVEFPDVLPVHTQILDMSGNEVLNLTSLPRLPDLRVLDVSRNWLHYVDNRWLFEHVAQLVVLKLADNGLRKLQHGTFIGLSHLLELDISGNRLQRAELHAFADLKQLEIFRMDKNDLFHVERSWFLAMPNLLELRLSNNGLARLENSTLRLPRLQHLDLSHNRLRRLDSMALDGVAKLRLLNLSENTQLREVPNEALKRVPGLDILLLDGLGLQRLPTHAVSELSTVELSLSYLPELRAVGRAAFHNLTRLQTLQLHDCPRLAFLHPEAFSGVPQLRRLLIHNNALVAVSERILAALPRLGDLHLYHNPLRCDCNVYWLRKKLSDYSRRYYASVNQALGTSRNTPSVVLTAISATPNVSAGSMHSNPSHSSPSTMSTSKPIITPISLTPPGSNIKNHKHQKLPFSPSIISEPGRVSCFFPDGASSLPLVQQPLQYFPTICPPVALPFFPPKENISLGEPLDLECQGVGVPEPSVSWVLPHGEVINASAYATRGREAETSASSSKLEAQAPSELTDSQFVGRTNYNQIKSRAQIREETTLHIPVARLQDSGTYRCRVASAQGQDFSSVLVHVQPKPLAFTELRVSNDHVTVVWEGSIPRAQMREFQLFYRTVTDSDFLEISKSTDESADGNHNSKRISSRLQPESGSESRSKENFVEHVAEYNFVNLPGARHTCTISSLTPKTRYEVCLVYRNVHPIQCRYITTASREAASVVRTGAGIAVRVSKEQIGAGIGVVLGALVLAWAALVCRRLRRRGRKNYQDYKDPLREEKASIPLEGLITTPAVGVAPSTPLTSSRTALLTHSQI